MGAAESAYTFDAENEGDAREKVEQAMAELRAENGSDSYAGHLGICNGIRTVTHTVPDRAAADRLVFGHETEDGGWREGLAEKWGPAILVPMEGGKWYVGGLCPE